jgi:hypothetical protein
VVQQYFGHDVIQEKLGNVKEIKYVALNASAVQLTKGLQMLY